jgi:type VI secretion system protein VasD
MANTDVTYRAMIGGIVLMMMVGCASAPPEDVTIKGSIQASEDVNPDASGRPSPLVIKIFQLKGRSKFEQAEYFALFDDAEATLGADLLAVEQLMLTPGEYRAYEGEFDPDTRFVGVIAGYRDINQAEWRSLVEMPEKSVIKFLKRSALVINAGRLSLSVNAGD